MTKVRKFLGAVMAAMLCFALTPAAAFAAAPTQNTAAGGNDDNGTIEIENAKPGFAYTAYQVMVLEKFDAGKGAYLYKAADGWSDWLDDQKDYVSKDANGYYSWVAANDQAPADFAKLAVEYATSSSLKDKGKTVTAAGDPAVAKFTGLNLGYYVVDSTMGALCMLTTTDRNAVIKEKNEAPTLDKQVFEGDGLATTNDASIGDTVKFKATVIAKAGAENYAIIDTMSDGLTFTGIESVTKNGTPVLDSSYTLTENVMLTEDSTATFELRFADNFCSTLQADDVLEVIYTATLNDKAVVKKPETNTAYLEYGDAHRTLPKTTTTYTWGMKVEKVDGNNPEQKLAGAQFTLLHNGQPVNLVFVDLVDGIQVYEVAKNGNVIQITTDETGTFVINGLDSGTYQLREDAAPQGYNKLDEPTTVTISRDVSEDGVIGLAPDTNVTVKNLTGSMLPSTGGIGTTIFYIVGGLLVVGAVVFFVRRRSHATK